MSRRVTNLVIRGKNAKGDASYALPLSKQELEILHINPDVDRSVVIQDNVFHGLSVKSQKQYDYDQQHSALSQVFDKFWQDHPEIKDREAYLKQFWDEQFKANQGEADGLDPDPFKGKETYGFGLDPDPEYNKKEAD